MQLKGILTNRDMTGLLKWEFFKLKRQSSTYYALVAFLVIEGFVMVTAYYQGKYILDTLLSTLQESFIFEGELLNGNLIIYIILNSLWFHVPLILMIVVSGMLSAEFKDGTIQSVLLQSVKRRDFIISKYLTAILFTLLVLVLLAVSTILVSYLVFGQGDLIVYFESLNIFSQADAQLRIIGAFITGTNTMVFYSVVAMTLAVIFRDPAKVWILAGLFLILSTLLSKIDFGSIMNEVLYVKHLDTWQYFFFYSLDLQTILMKNLILLAYEHRYYFRRSKTFLKTGARMIYLISLILNFSLLAGSQNMDPDLQRVKERLDAIESFEVDLGLELDVSFINMPPKQASMIYERDKPVKFSSEDFIMIPKRGLDFSFRELFQYPFITVPLGTSSENGRTIKSMHVIPQDDRSDLVMVTLHIDTELDRFVRAEVNTKKDGSYQLFFTYEKETAILPDALEVAFQIERIRIPFNFVGKDTDIDRKKMKEEGDKEGTIFLTMTNYRFN